jgi:hypothetical protein
VTPFAAEKVRGLLDLYSPSDGRRARWGCILREQRDLFAALPPHDLQPIAAVAEEHVFSEGDTLAAQGEPGDPTS